MCCISKGRIKAAKSQQRIPVKSQYCFRIRRLFCKPPSFCRAYDFHIEKFSGIFKNLQAYLIIWCSNGGIRRLRTRENNTGLSSQIRNERGSRYRLDGARAGQGWHKNDTVGERRGSCKTGKGDDVEERNGGVAFRRGASRHNGRY